MILHEIFHVISRFPRYISCYIAESRLPLGQCTSVYDLTTSRHWSTSLLVNNNGNISQRWALEVFSLVLWLTIVNIAETVAAVREVIGSLNDSDLFGLRNDYVMYIVSPNNS